MFDIGVNLLHPQFDPDRDDVLVRAHAAGVTGLLITSTDLPMTEQAIVYCNEHDLYCTAGVHPHDAQHAPDDLTERLTDLCRSNRVKAIGETGLDFNRNYSPPAIQRQVFAAQLAVAQSSQLPVFVHDRDSDGATAASLASCRERLAGVVVHCFTGTAMDLDRYLSLDCHIGITGWICDRKRGEELRTLVRRVPHDRLLLETDAPFLCPQNLAAHWHAEHTAGISRRRNEPALLPLVAATVAEQLGTSVAELAALTSRNAHRLFGIAD